MRNGYAQAQDDHDEAATDRVMAALSVKQVRLYTRLPPGIANLWMNAGAPVRALWEAIGYGVKTDADVLIAERRPIIPAMPIILSLRSKKGSNC